MPVYCSSNGCVVVCECGVGDCSIWTVVPVYCSSGPLCVVVCELGVGDFSIITTLPVYCSSSGCVVVCEDAVGNLTIGAVL